VLEIGCGTGNLADPFTYQGFSYTGMDNSDEMLHIAARKHPRCQFIKEDMRQFALSQATDAAIITGRTISYLLNNKDVMDALTAIHKNLKHEGILCFDFIDANKFIPQINKGQRIEHKATSGDKKFHRDSFWSLNLAHGWTFNWQSVYYGEDDNGKLNRLGEDNSTIRAFCKDEMILFLQLAGFQVKEIIPRTTYAFDTFVMVAEKRS
jgi:SAM-dependent methyltransferase